MLTCHFSPGNNGRLLFFVVNNQLSTSTSTCVLNDVVFYAINHDKVELLSVKHNFTKLLIFAYKPIQALKTPSPKTVYSIWKLDCLIIEISWSHVCDVIFLLLNTVQSTTSWASVFNSQSIVASHLQWIHEASDTTQFMQSVY